MTAFLVAGNSKQQKQKSCNYRTLSSGIDNATTARNNGNATSNYKSKQSDRQAKRAVHLNTDLSKNEANKSQLTFLLQRCRRIRKRNGCKRIQITARSVRDDHAATIVARVAAHAFGRISCNSFAFYQRPIMLEFVACLFLPARRPVVNLLANSYFLAGRFIDCEMFCVCMCARA